MAPCQRAQEQLNLWRSSEQDHFIPKTISLQIFNRQSVRGILQCCEGNCRNCSRDYKFICSGKGIKIRPSDDIDRIIPAGHQSNDQTTSAVQLFALLVKIGHPLLIVPLLENGRNDFNTLDSYCEGSFKFPNIREKYWKDCSRSDDPQHKYSEVVANLIQDNFSVFFRPILKDEKFHNQPQTVKLPFFNERKIGEGSFGRVYAFQIYEGHNNLPNFVHVQKFARKVISRNDDTGFLPGYREGLNLSLVNGLKTPHIVRVVTSFTYKDEFNIVFPLANTNLEKALREPRHRLGQIVPPLRSCPIWPQMLGLAEALRDFSNGDWNRETEAAGNSKSDKDLENRGVISANSVGIHFDLKPSNILVDRPSRNPLTFHFRIADFGLAYVKDANIGSSGTGGRGGDEAYAAPEVMQDKQTRKYDVWSLGCIFLELLVFLVMGYEGVRKLDDVRTGPNTRARQNRCFWEEIAGSGPALKEDVKNLVLEIQKRADIPGQYSPEEQRLIKNTIVMIMKKMLLVEPESRLNASEVVWWLKRIGRGQDFRGEQAELVLTETISREIEPPVRRQTANSLADQQIVSKPWWEPAVRAEEDVHLAERTDKEIEIEPKSLRKMRKLLIRSNIDPGEEDSCAVLQIFADQEANLRFVVTSINLVGQQPLEQNCPRQYVHLMPQYAFRKSHNTKRSDAGIRLVWSHNLRKSIMRYDLSGEYNDLRIIHGALLDQDIYHTIEVDNVRFVRSKRWLRSPKLEGTDEEGPLTVQLWREKTFEALTERRRKARACRLVIYFASKVYVIPFHQYFRFPKEEIVSNEDLTVLESGKVGDTKQTFEMTVLIGTQPGVLPTFPLNAADLDKLLTDQPTAFESVGLSFRTHEDLYDFWNAYRVLKEDWLDETGIKRKLTSNVAAVLKLDLV